MRIEEALQQSNGKTVYAVYHGDLLTIYQREDGHYVQEVIDLDDATERSTYISRNLAHALRRDRRYLAEWYLSEDAARYGRRPEEFYIYTTALYQHKVTRELIYAKFCNGELLSIGESERSMNTRHSQAEHEQRLREFLLHPDEYRHLTTWWLSTQRQSDREKGYAKKAADREKKYCYTYLNRKDGKEYQQYTRHVRDVVRLAHAHIRGEKKQPLAVSGPDIGRIELHPQKLPNDQFRIPELEPFETRR